MKITRRTLLALAGALCLPAPVLAQTKAAEPLLRIVGQWELGGLEPSVSGYLFTRMQVAETLTEADPAGRPMPGLAARWSVSPDRLTWRFVLRPDARFHDGTAVTAATVAAAVKRAHARPGVLDAAPITAVEASADEIVIRLKSPFAALPALLAHSSTMVLAPSSFDASGAVRAIIASGPYRVVSMQPPQRFEVALYEGWSGKRPAITRASYLAAGRAETRALLAESGQADIVFGIDPASVQRLRRSPRVSIAAVTVPRTVILKLNAGHRLLAEPQARQALSLALQRDGLARGVLRDPELAATQLFPPSLAEWHVQGLPPLAYDPARARALLAGLGWRPGADGILQRNGERFELTLRTFPDRAEQPLIAAAVQEQWRQIGVALKVAIGNSGDIPLGHRDGSLEVGLAARNFALVPDPIGTLLQDYGAKGGDWGAMNWNNKELLATLDMLARGADDIRRAALRGQVARVLHEELPVIPLTWYRQTAAVTTRIDGFILDPLERSYGLTNITWRAAAAKR